MLLLNVNIFYQIIIIITVNVERSTNDSTLKIYIHRFSSHLHFLHIILLGWWERMIILAFTSTTISRGNLMDQNNNKKRQI